MTIITKGMGVIKKELFKRSRKFPGKGAEKQLDVKVKKQGGIGPREIDIHARIGRTQRYRNLKAAELREARKGKK